MCDWGVEYVHSTKACVVGRRRSGSMATITHDDAVGSMRTRVRQVCPVCPTLPGVCPESAESAAATFFLSASLGLSGWQVFAAVRRILY